MKIENQEVIYCPEGDENRIYCDKCDKLCIDRYYENQLKAQTHTNIFRKKDSNLISLCKYDLAF